MIIIAKIQWINWSWEQVEGRYRERGRARREREGGGHKKLQKVQAKRLHVFAIKYEYVNQLLIEFTHARIL